MGTEKSRNLVLPVLLVILATFFASYYSSTEITGFPVALKERVVQPIKTVPSTPPSSAPLGQKTLPTLQGQKSLSLPQKTPNCIYNEKEIPVASDGKTMTQKDILFCKTMVLSKEYIINIPSSKISCLQGVTLNYDNSQRSGLYNGLHILPSVANVQIEYCGFEGSFRAAIQNEGANTVVRSSGFKNTEIGIHETEKASGSIYISIMVSKNKNIGLLLEGNGAQVQTSVFTSNNIGIKTGKEMTPKPIGTNTVCSQNQGELPMCSDPASGKNVYIWSNDFQQNTMGIQVFGLYNKIDGNKVDKGNEGIAVHPIYVGTVNDLKNPNYPWDFFSSGVTIENNEIEDNAVTGVHLEEYSLDTTGKMRYGSVSPPSKYYAVTIIRKNNLDNNGEGIIVDCPKEYGVISFIPGWWEYTKIEANNLMGNKKNGIKIGCGGGTTFIAQNTVTTNGNNGVYISQTQARSRPGGFISGNYEVLYDNDIKSNAQHGVFVENGFLTYTIKNEINANGKVGYKMGPSSFGYPHAYRIDCNDLSYNNEEGFYADVTGPPGQLVASAYAFSDFIRNRVIVNGISNNEDGAKIYLNRPLPPGYDPSKNYPFIQDSQRILVNLFLANYGYGLNIDGGYGAFLATNNFLPNNKGDVVDSGVTKYENMWDEEQYRKFFDYTGAQCNVGCTTDLDCGLYSKDACQAGICTCPSQTICNTQENTCNVYVSYRRYLSWPQPYTPYGNFFNGKQPVDEINTNKPPLVTCTKDTECLYHDCYNQKNVCGDRDEITSQMGFAGFYDPQDPDACPYLGIDPPAQGNSFCGDGAIDPGEQCDPNALPNGCPSSKLCTTSCICQGGGTGEVPIEFKGSSKEENTIKITEDVKRRYPSTFTPEMISYVEEQRREIDKKLDDHLRKAIKKIDIQALQKQYEKK